MFICHIFYWTGASQPDWLQVRLLGVDWQVGPERAVQDKMIIANVKDRKTNKQTKLGGAAGLRGKKRRGEENKSLTVYITCMPNQHLEEEKNN